uniref:Uncharacterized protein n=1 Tax=Strigamia maritima TaxID=126957 RepID=T1JKN6_STRMM
MAKNFYRKNAIDFDLKSLFVVLKLSFRREFSRLTGNLKVTPYCDARISITPYLNTSSNYISSYHLSLDGVCVEIALYNTDKLKRWETGN